MTKRERVLNWFDDFAYEIGVKFMNAWLILRHRPFVKCPCCDGKGGAMSGYYEPEWSECSVCWRHWEDLENIGMEWFVGRLPVWEWVRAKVAMKWSIPPMRVRDTLRCKLGWHRWMNEDESEPGLRVCAFCYEHRNVLDSEGGPDASALPPQADSANRSEAAGE